MDWIKEQFTEERHSEERESEGIFTEETDTEEPCILQRQLQEYAARDLYPFHMPGHKRRVQPAPGLPYGWDVTEVPGTDDLHDAHGILEAAMKRTAALYGSDRTWYLVGGSTCGLLAGIRALARRGSEVLCARNCHKAVFHALELSGYRVRWIMPALIPEWGICGGISAEHVRAMLGKYPSARAVILTSPTYEGVLSEVEGICEACHEKNIPVLVDEAHGAHLLPLSLKAGFPKGAVACGADLVVQSPHKTLPSLTQTALLHLNGKLVDPGRIERELDIFETSSPSYPLMASLDGCTGILRKEGGELFEKWRQRLARFDAAVHSLQKIRILGHGEPCGEAELRMTEKDRVTAQAGRETSETVPEPSVKGRESPGTGWKEPGDDRETSETDRDEGGAAAFHDPGRILIDTSRAGMTGQEAAGILRDHYHLETEYARGCHVLAMSSPCDSEDALDRLAAALKEMDTKAAAAAASRGKADGMEKSPEDTPVFPAGSLPSLELLTIRPAAACTIAQAAEQETEEVPLEEASGRICAEYLYEYPPGIPFLAPGEIISHKTAGILKKEAENGRTFYGCRDRQGTVLCLRE